MDGKKTLAEIARVMGNSSSFDTAKVVYGLITSGLVEMRSREAPRPAPGGRAADRAPARRARRPAPTPALLGDEKKILMILCTRVKQEAEIAIGESNLPGIERPYKQALAEIDRGRGVEAVRDLIRETEKTISSIADPPG